MNPKLVFQDELFDAQFLRALSHVHAQAAEIGECFSIAKYIQEPDPESWYRAWFQFAEKVSLEAQSMMSKGHTHSARMSFLRASNYYRTSYVFLFGAPVDARLVHAHKQQTWAFRQAGVLCEPAIESIQIPFEQAFLSGYFLRTVSNEPRPTLIVTGGYDSTAEELYNWVGAAAHARGYHVVLFDGPGQGDSLIQKGQRMRLDWEHVLHAVVDYALTRSEVDSQRLGLIGISWGGYLAARAAAYEPRLAACVLDPAQLNPLAAFFERLPSGQHLYRRIVSLKNKTSLSVRVLDELLRRWARHPTKGWALRRGQYVHGVLSPVEYLIDLSRYNLVDDVKLIQCPTLVCDAENDPLSKHARQFYDSLGCDKKEYAWFSNEEGAGEHCECNGRVRWQARVFNWLDSIYNR